ncbi:MAG TPA: hypothetical protein VFJ91_02630 [Gaiellaceae bacterium]|nr:hypothetical protein [Gaiellaceae bacterium]
MAARLVLLAALAVAIAGCGGGSHAAGTTVPDCVKKARATAMARLNGDIAALRFAAKQPAKSRLLGGPAANHATDRFLLDLATAPITNLVRNRLIDHAASAIVGACQQCFQALEAERPIPAIAHDGRQKIPGCAKKP